MAVACCESFSKLSHFMEESLSSTAAFMPVETLTAEGLLLPSISTTDSSKSLTRRRRNSLFEPRRCSLDVGNAFLSHADFPKSRMKASVSLNHQINSYYEFNKEAAYRIMEQVVSMELSLKSYNSKECALSTQNISLLIKDKLSSSFDLSHYKIICLCQISKRAKPSPAIDSGCAWNDMKCSVERDVFVDYVYKNRYIVAIATVFAIDCRRHLGETLDRPGERRRRDTIP